MNDAVFISGTIANAGQIEDSGDAKIEFITGSHKNHTADYLTTKHNCGSWQEDVTCQCGSEWSNAMNGCWQQGHQREESGDESLEPNIINRGEPVERMDENSATVVVG